MKFNSEFDFYQYDPALSLTKLEAEGTAALKAELSRTRSLYENLRSIVEHSRDGIFVTDGFGNVIMVNQSYQEMSGVSREEILGKNMSELENVTITRSATLIALHARKPVTIRQQYLRTKRLVYITSTPIFGPDGSVVMVVSNNRDFQEIERLNREMQAAGGFEATKRQAQQYQERVKAIENHLRAQQELVVEDEKTFEVFYQAAKIAASDVSVILSGETGTGKEEVTSFIHRNSRRMGGPFIRINCSAITASLMEAELFGYEKGSFTGALHGGRAGYFEAADKGTLFLDEVGEMNLDVQAKLLRVLQEGEVIRVGGTRPVPVNVRVIAATNRDLRKMVEEKTFREDLYYRLGVVQIRIPPLRERRGDILPLAQLFLQHFDEKFGRSHCFSASLEQALLNYSWPGNVRELKNLIQRAVLMSDEEELEPAQLFEVSEGSFGTASGWQLEGSAPYPLSEQQGMPTFRGEEIGAEGAFSLKAYLEQMELACIEDCYARCGTLERTAKALSMNLKTLARRKRQLEARWQKQEPIEKK